MKYPKRCQYKHAKQKKYHVRNWAEYNEGLRRRGDLTVWFDEEAIANWKADKTGKPGGQRVYSDMAIETGLVVRMVYKLAYRQTEGFLHSIASLLGLGIEIPDYSTLCRRSRLLRKKLRIPKAASTQPIHLMIDSTGLRIHVGTARKPPKQRAWRKLHIAVDRETGNIVASELTASRARDATRVPALLTQIQAPLVSVAADSAYDKEAVYEAIEAHSPGRRTRVVIPPQRNATLSQNSNTAMQERDHHIRAIERHGRREWYKLSGYTKRSMVENAVYRYKAIIGPERRCCTALAESEIRLWWWPRYVSSMKYPKRCQYKHAKQKKYHVRNWAEYNEGLRRRGDLTIWFDEEAIANWKADKTGKPGGQRVYSDMAIETGLVVRMVYKLAYRQTEGFLHSIASLLGLGIEIPDYSTLCRRSRLLRKKLRIPKAASTQPIHLMIDSTGLRIHVGTARKPPKQRAWRKLHIAVDRETGNIVASELTASRARDATRVPALLTQIQAPLVSVAADSAYDKEAVYEAIEAHSPGRRTRVVIPPQRNATLSQNSNTAMQERDRHIRAIERHGRREWYKLSGYTKRSMVENAVYRYKAIIGPEMRARTLARQRVEHRIGCEILNKMAALGMPDTYCAG